MVQAASEKKQVLTRAYSAGWMAPQYVAVLVPVVKQSVKVPQSHSWRQSCWI